MGYMFVPWVGGGGGVAGWGGGSGGLHHLFLVTLTSIFPRSTPLPGLIFSNVGCPVLFSHACTIFFMLA